MFEHETVTQIIFRVLNFGVMIAVFGYLARAYGLPLIRKQMDEIQAQRKAIEELQRALEYQKDELTHTITADKQLISTLEERVARWTLYVEARHKKHAAKKELIARALADKNVCKEERLRMVQAQKTIVPQAIAQAQQELIEHFSQHEAGMRYVEQMIDRLKSRGN